MSQNNNMSARIDAMFKQDKVWALGFVVLLWLCYAYVFFDVGTINTDASIKIALMIGGGLVLLYNTASIIAMIRHYAHDKKDIYSIDILHLDEMKKAKRGR